MMFQCQVMVFYFKFKMMKEIGVMTATRKKMAKKKKQMAAW